MTGDPIIDGGNDETAEEVPQLDQDEWSKEMLALQVPKYSFPSSREKNGQNTSDIPKPHLKSTEARSALGDLNRELKAQGVYCYANLSGGCLEQLVFLNVPHKYLSFCI